MTTREIGSSDIADVTTLDGTETVTLQQAGVTKRATVRSLSGVPELRLSRYANDLGTGNATTDTAALAWALSNVPPGGTIVNDVAGQLQISSPQTLATANVRMVNTDGAAGFLATFVGTFLTVSADGFCAEGTTYVGSDDAAYGDFMFKFSGVEDIKLEGITASKTGVVVEVTKCIGVKMTECDFRDLLYAGFLSYSMKDFEIGHNLINGISGDPAQSFRGYGVGLFRQETSDDLETEYPTQIGSVHHNTVKNNPTWEGLDTHGGTDISFDNNTILGCKNGIVLTPGDDQTSAVQLHAPKRISVTGNTIETTIDNGECIVVAGAQDGTPVDYCTSVAVVGNTMEGGGALTTSAFRGAVRARTTRGLVISGNSMNASFGSAVLFASDNFGSAVTGNTAVDPHGVSTRPSLLRATGDNQTGSVTGNTLLRGDLTAGANSVCEYGIYTNAAGSKYFTAGNNFDDAVVSAEGGLGTYA